MDYIQPVFTEEYYKPEVRENFRIAEMTKRYMAAQLKVLSEIDKICKRHNIRWFADFGTLLGAVRHRGFIPWDDDIDISMPRSDYEHFLQAAIEELPENYRVFDVLITEDYSDPFGRVVNNSRIEYGEEYLKENCGCPYTAGIDIYPLDAVYDDEEDEQDRCERAMMVRRVYDMVESGHGSSRECKMLLTRIEMDNNVRLSGKSHLKYALENLLRAIYSECLTDRTEYIAYMSGWTSRRLYRYKREWFEHTEYLPFENIEIPVPRGYDDVLKVMFGNYMNYNRSGSSHSYPVYREQQQILIEHLNRESNKKMLDYITRTSDKHEEHDRKCTEILDMCDHVMGVIHGQMAGSIVSCQMLLQGMIQLMDSLESLVIADYSDTITVIYRIRGLRDILPTEAVSEIPTQDEFDERIGRIDQYLKDIRKGIDELYRGSERIC